MTKREAQLREIVAARHQLFKIFLAYKGAFGIDDRSSTARSSWRRNSASSSPRIAKTKRSSPSGRRNCSPPARPDPEHHESRPPPVEAEGVHHLMTFAELTGAHVYIVHLSCEEALREAIAARQRGVRVWVETLIQYLLLDKTYAEKPDFEGAKYVMSPPLRDRRNQAVLWNGLRERPDPNRRHRPRAVRFRDAKPMGSDDFTKIPNGIPSLEERVNLLYTYGVKAGRIDLHTFVNIASTQVAKIFDLFPRKGTIQPGGDADLVVFDPDYRGTISAKTQLMNVDYSAFEGWEIEGRPRVSPCAARSRCAMENLSERSAAENSSSASRVISRFSAGAKNEQLLPNPGKRRHRALSQAYLYEDEYFAGDRTVAETGSENIGERLSAHPFFAGTSEVHLGILAATSRAGCARQGKEVTTPRK